MSNSDNGDSGADTGDSEFIKGLRATGLTVVVIDENTTPEDIERQLGDLAGDKTKVEEQDSLKIKAETSRATIDGQRPKTPEGYYHKEAFCLMWYECVRRPDLVARKVVGVELRLSNRPGCGHMEKFWNSRDGVTPFTTTCPSCGGELQHVHFGSDLRRPDHVPWPGQKLWVDVSFERAMFIAERRLLMMKNSPDPQWRTAYEVMTDEELAMQRSRLADAIFNEGNTPDMFCMPWYGEWENIKGTLNAR